MATKSKGKNAGISRKLLTAPLIVAGLLLLFGLFSHFTLSGFREGVDRLLSDSIAQERMAMEEESVLNATHAIVYRSLAMLDLGSRTSEAAANEMMSKQLTAMTELKQGLQAEGSDTSLKLLKQFETYETSIKDAFDAAISDKNLGVLMLQQADTEYDQLIAELQRLSTAARLQSMKDQTELAEQMSFMQLVQVLVLLAVILLGPVRSVLTGRQIAGALTRMVKEVQSVERDCDFSRRLRVDSADELGQAAESINALMSAIESGVREVNDAVDGLAQGDFSRVVQSELRGDLGTMKEAVNSSVGQIRETVSALNAMMEALQAGNFSAQTTGSASGEYQRALDQAAEAMTALRSMLGEVGSVMNKVAQGDLTGRVRAEGRGDLAVLKDNINRSLEALSGAMQTVNANTRQVAAASNETSSAIGQISDGAQNQTLAISQVATAVRQTSASVADVSRNTEVASQRSRDSVTIIRDGMAKMERMVEVVSSIAANSEKINKITEVIEKIANKTNLLSLNAAIEAARAGEHGKGFAVVADEVGKLAVNSAESSQEIAQLVQQAVAETNKAVEAVREVSADMAKIEHGSQETDAMLQRISAALEQQSSAVEEINANLSSLDKIARSNAAAAEQITATVMELSKIADATRQEVERFRA
jgi:methyl-accepting chemotaxis protein